MVLLAVPAAVLVLDCIQYVCRYVFMYTCVVISSILDGRLGDAPPAGVTQEEGHTGFLHLPSAVLALSFLARRIRPFLSLVDREVECYTVVRITDAGTSIQASAWTNLVVSPHQLLIIKIG